MRLGLLPARLAPALFGLIATFLLVAGTVNAAEPVFPPLTGRVNDEAGILSPQTRQQLDAVLAQQEQATRQQIVVVTLKSLQGYAIEDFGYQLGRRWGIGEKGRDTGALLIVAPNERKVRIEVGYGLEDRLTDARSRAIIEATILPAFRRGDFDGGVRDGIAAMLRVLGGGAAPEAGQPAPQGGADPLQTFAVFALILFGWLVFRGFFLPLLLIGGARQGRFNRHGTGYWFGGGGGGFSGGGFSGGGFSGGGGSFGGGGASGGW
jgi:uncharacterized protein